MRLVKSLARLNQSVYKALVNKFCYSQFDFLVFIELPRELPSAGHLSKINGEKSGGNRANQRRPRAAFP